MEPFPRGKCLIGYLENKPMLSNGVGNTFHEMPEFLCFSFFDFENFVVGINDEGGFHIDSFSTLGVGVENGMVFLLKEAFEGDFYGEDKPSLFYRDKLILEKFPYLFVTNEILQSLLNGFAKGVFFLADLKKLLAGIVKDFALWIEDAVKVPSYFGEVFDAGGDAVEVGILFLMVLYKMKEGHIAFDEREKTPEEEGFVGGEDVAFDVKFFEEFIYFRKLGGSKGKTCLGELHILCEVLPVVLEVFPVLEWREGKDHVSGGGYFCTAGKRVKKLRES